MAGMRFQTVHASFSSKVDAPLLCQVQTAVYKAGCKWTADHNAQTEAWFQVWGDKARLADCIVVMFTSEYKGRFTDSLRMEAEMIHTLYQRGTNVYIFDSDTHVTASDVRANLTDGVTTMGSISEWWAFCSARGARSSLAAPAPTPSTTAPSGDPATSSPTVVEISLLTASSPTAVETVSLLTTSSPTLEPTGTALGLYMHAVAVPVEPDEVDGKFDR